MPKYENFGRSILISLLHLKNKKINSQRSMLFQLRKRRDQLKEYVNLWRNLNVENDKLKQEVANLKGKIKVLQEWRKRTPFSTSEHGGLIMDAILNYENLKASGEFQVNEIMLLILIFKNQWILQREIENYKRYGIIDCHWKRDMAAYCESSYFTKGTANKYYYLAYRGLERLDCILKKLHQECKKFR